MLSICKSKMVKQCVQSDYSSPMVATMSVKGNARIVLSINILGVGSNALNNVCLAEDRQGP
jgi:hypothetical protein